MIPAIELLKTADLKPHPLSVKIYGEPTASEELLRSIAEIGVVQPIVVDTNNSIIAGTSRHFAAVQAQQETIPATRFAGSALDGEWLVIESNRQRVKTACQLGWEFNERFRLEGERAKARQLCGRDLPPEMAEGRSDARDRAARAIGLGRTTAERIGFLVAKAEEGNPRPRKLIAEIDIGKLSISGAWDLWKPTQKKCSLRLSKVWRDVLSKGSFREACIS